MGTQEFDSVWRLGLFPLSVRVKALGGLRDKIHRVALMLLFCYTFGVCSSHVWKECFQRDMVGGCVVRVFDDWLRCDVTYGSGKYCGLSSAGPRIVP